MPLALGSIVQALGGELAGDPALVIDGIAPLEEATASQLSFLSNPRYQQQLADSKAGCVIVAPQFREQAAGRGACIVTPDPYLYFARVTQLWKKQEASVQAGPAIHASAVVDPDAVIDPTARIGALCIVERGARIGAGTVLKARVTVAENCTIGERCILHPGVVIGADGFGFAPNAGSWEKIEQLGAVRIGNDVEIGANTCIDRGALQDTVLEDGVKLDNLIQIGHNVRIGKHTAMAACSGIAGSTTVGAHCTIGGSAGLVGHITLADHVHVSAFTMVTRSISRPGVYTGAFPFDDNEAWERNAAALKQLYKLRERVKALEKKTQ